jgi:hypothetical protein
MLQVTPAGLLGRFATKFGRQDIQVADEEFNKGFEVRSDDPEFAVAVLTPALTARLAERTEYGMAMQGWRIDGDTILSWRRGKHAPDELNERFIVLDAVVDSVPAETWQYYGTGPLN